MCWFIFFNKMSIASHHFVKGNRSQRSHSETAATETATHRNGHKPKRPQNLISEYIARFMNDFWPTYIQSIRKFYIHSHPSNLGTSANLVYATQKDWATWNICTANFSFEEYISCNARYCCLTVISSETHRQIKSGEYKALRIDSFAKCYIHEI